MVRQRVDGGEPEQLTLAETRGGSGQLQVHSDPKFLPGGRHLLFSVGWGFLQSDWEIAVLDLDTREWRTVFKEANQASYVDGHLVFWRDGRLWAAPFELDTLAVTAPPQPVLDDVDPHPGAPVEVGQFHIGGDGSLVYVGGGELQRGTSHLVLIDEVGASTLATVEGLLTSPRLSPDGRTVAVERCPGGRPAAVDPTSMPCRVWLFELATSAWTPISDPRADLSAPIWHPFGASLVATQLRSSAGRAVVRRDLDGPEDWKVVWSDPNATFVAAVGFARDGRLVLNRAPEPLRSDVLLIGPDSETTTLIGDPTADEFATDLSSDGRWLLYHSNRGGRYEVFLLDLEGPGLAERQLTTEGGQHAVFAPDDASIYYRSASYPEPSEILKAPLDLVDARLGKAETLLETRRPRASRPEALLLGMLEGTETGVLASRREVGAPGGRLILIPGWADELGRRLGTE